MIHRLRTMLFLVGMLLAGIQLQGATITVGDFTYTTSGTKAKLTKGPTTGAIVIPDTIEHNGTKYAVTEVYNKAFQKTAITSVTVPGTVTQIGSNAFENCAQLASVTLSEGLQKIQSYAFKNCTALPEIHFPSTVTLISSYAFDGCVKLTSIVIPDKCNMLMSYPFQNCTSLRSITIGAKLTSFSGNECKNCPLEEVLVAEGNTRLKSVDGVLYDNKITKLQFFPWYKNVETFTLPATVTRINGFSKVQYVKTFIGEGLTYTGSSQFQECPVLEKVVLGKDLSEFGYRCFEKSPKMQTVEIAADNPYLRCSDGVVTSTDGKVLYVRFPFAQGTEYTAPAALTTIAPYAFYTNALLEKVTLPAGVDSIGYSAFAQCKALTEINVPAGVRDLAENLFSRCGALKNVTLPDSLQSIGNSTFYYCTKLDSIKFPALLRKIGENAFNGTALAIVDIPDSVREIGAQAFEYCDHLLNVSIGAGVDTIGDRAFRNYFEIEPTIYIKATVPPRIRMEEYYAPFEQGQTIYVEQAAYDAYKADSAYKAYKIVVRASLRELTVTLDQPGTLSQKVAASDLTGIIGLTVKGAMNGDDFAYMNRMPLIRTLDLSDVRIVTGGADSVRTVADELPSHSVRGLDKLETISLPSTLTAIADSALCSYSDWGDKLLRRADIPASVTRIGARAFTNRAALQSATLPAGLKKLGEGAFLGCTALTRIEIPAGIDTLRAEAFFGCSNVESIKFNEGLKAIEERTFYGLTKVTDLLFPSTLDSIGNWGFADLRSLVNISLPEGMRILNRNAFSFCSSLEEVHLPDKVELIGSSCFSSCGKLTKINIPESVRRIDDSAFVMDSALLRIDIPRYVTYIGRTMFERCRSLRLATVGYDYEVPGESGIEPADSALLPAKVMGRSQAFANCTSLEAIYIGSRVNFLGEDFLANTPSLKRIFVANPVPPDMFDGEPAFDRYDADLYVPKASIQAYRTNRHWKYFSKIHAIENQYNAIGDLFDDPDSDTVFTEDGAIMFADPEASVSVVSVAGQLIYRGKARRLEVTPGMYIVRVNSRSFKVLVR